MNGGEQHGQLCAQFIERTFAGLGLGADEQLAMGEEVRTIDEHAEPPPKAVPRDGGTDVASDRERHAERDDRLVVEIPAPQCLAPGAATMTAQSLELTPLADSSDQADRRVRPLSRRALMIERKQSCQTWNAGAPSRAEQRAQCTSMA